MALAVSITKPTVGGSSGTWGTTLNTALDALVAGFNTDVQAELDLKAALAGAAFTGAVSVAGNLTVSGSGQVSVTGTGGLSVSGGSSVLYKRLHQLNTRSSGGTSNTVNPDMANGNVFIQTMSTNASCNFGAVSNAPAAAGLQEVLVFITAHSGGNAITSSGGAVTVGMPAAFGASSVNLIRLSVANGYTVYEYVGVVA